MAWQPIPLRPGAAPYERDIRADILNELRKFKDIRIVRNFNGMVRPLRDNASGPTVPFAVGIGDGSADIVGILRVRVQPVGGAPLYIEGSALPSGWGWDGESRHSRFVGRVFALEIKRPGAKAHPHEVDQRAWRQCVRDFGGFATEVRSVEEALNARERALLWADE